MYQSIASNEQWKTVALGEVAIFNESLISKDHQLLFINYLDTGSITEGRVDCYQRLVPSQDKIPSRARRKCRPGDIVYSTVRPIQRHYGILHEQPENLVVSTGFAVIRADELNAHTEFLYWFLIQDRIVEQLQVVAEHSTSAYPSIRASDLARVVVSLPPLGEQKMIASFLRAIDDRIELNRRMCETLEEMASALFKAWFIDFEPVRARMEGRWREGESLPGLPAHLYDCFPSDFVDSEYGPIPGGWQLESLGSVLQLLYGRALPASKRIAGSVPVFGSNGRVGWHNEKYVDGPGIIVGRKGNPGTVVRVHEGFYPIDTTYYVEVSDERLTLEFLYYALGLQELVSIGADSAVPGLNRNLAYMSKQLIPTKALIDAFSSYVSRLWKLDHMLDQNSVRLAHVRNALLPKLISGKIRLPSSKLDDPLGNESLTRCEPNTAARPS